MGKTGQDGAKMAKIPPRAHQEGWDLHTGPLQKSKENGWFFNVFAIFGISVPRCAKIGQERRKMSQDRPQDGPRCRQDGAKMGQEGAKMGQDGAKMGHIGDKTSQDGAKMCQDVAKIGQDGPR